MIEAEECPSCGSMVFAEDFEEGYCSECGAEFEMESAA